MKIIETHERLQNDLIFFAANAPLMIRDKSGAKIPLRFNQAQMHVHQELERQLMNTGKVRALIIKGRQQGVSTLIEARFLHKSTRQGSKSVFILTHNADSTDKLFKMTKRFYENLDDTLKPSLAGSNRKELIFDKIESDFFVGTAGNKEVGRGGTIQFFHGSEAAFWPNTDEIKAGVLQSVSKLPGTEIILESTANGLGNMFHEMAMNAIKGIGEYILIFVPWFWQDEYRQTPPIDWEPDDEALEYKELYNLDIEQIYWRHLKIIEIGTRLFKQEYPATAIEAFQTTGGGLIKPEDIVRARNCQVKDKDAPMVLGVDPARKGGDRTILCFRRGREVPKYYKFDEMDSMRLAGIIATLLEKHPIVKTFIDVGMGYGTIDRLRELGYGDRVVEVSFGAQATESDLYINKRVEMWCNMNEWLSGGDVNIPDDDEIHADLAIMPDVVITSANKKKLVAKDEIKKKYGRSPDIGDALALTFFMPVSSNAATAGVSKIIKKNNSNSPLKTMRNRRG